VNSDSSQKTRDEIVCVFVPYWGPGNPYQDELAKSLEFHGFKVEKGDSFKTIFHRIIFGHYRPDIVHLHWLPSIEIRLISFPRLILFVLRMSFLRILGYKLVWTAHNLRPHESKNIKMDLLLVKFVMTLANAIIVHGNTAKKEIVSIFHLKNREKVFVIPHGNFINNYDNSIDRTNTRGKLGISNSKFVILFLGGIRPYKGVLELIEAFKKLSENDTRVELVIAGRPLSSEFSSAIKAKIGGSKGIHYKPGFVPEDEVQVYMNACDVVVFPYREILTSGAVILAMSFGKPCIAPRLGCIPDVLDNKGAFLYEPDGEEALLKTLRYAIERKGELQCMGEHNRRLAEQWNWISIAEKTKDVYWRCLSQKT